MTNQPESFATPTTPFTRDVVSQQVLEHLTRSTRTTPLQYVWVAPEQNTSPFTINPVDTWRTMRSVITRQLTDAQRALENLENIRGESGHYTPQEALFEGAVLAYAQLLYSMDEIEEEREDYESRNSQLSQLVLKDD